MKVGFIVFSEKAVLLYNEMQDFFFIELMLQRHLVFMVKRLSYYSFILALFERFLLLTDTMSFRSLKIRSLSQS